MADFNQDVSKYLRFLSDNPQLISSTGAEANAHNDLVPHILQQLRATTIPLFQQAILRWQLILDLTTFIQQSILTARMVA